jgi:BirA family biotin operon repressor/biotin-[acetyl-CoA-carboxylase] ligase
MSGSFFPAIQRFGIPAQSYEISLHKLFSNTVFIGKKAFFLPVCHSTNEMAAVLIAKGDSIDGTVIYTDHQLVGKGQRGNRWESEPGSNLLLSVILDVGFVHPEDNFLLTQATSLAIFDLLRDYLPEGLKVKWPNDIVAGGNKIAGILIENYIRQNRIERSIVGIGINVNQKQFLTPGATSMAVLCGQTFNREELLNLLLTALERRLLQLRRSELAGIQSHYLDALYWRDEIHVFQSDEGYFNGRITGIDSRGRLHITVESGERFFDLKEVKFIR